MEETTDYGKLAYLKTDDLSKRIAALEGRKSKAAEIYRSIRGVKNINAAAAYLYSSDLFTLDTAAGAVHFEFRIRLGAGAGRTEGSIHFYAGGTLLSGGTTSAAADGGELFFSGCGELSAGAHTVTARFEGFTGRQIISCDYCVSGTGVAFMDADNFLSVCVDENSVMYAVYSIPSGATRITNDSGATWRNLYNPGTLGKTALTLTQKNGLKYALKQITIQNGVLYELNENSGGRIVDRAGGITYACAAPIKGVDGAFNIIFIRGNKAYYCEVNDDYICRPAPLLPSHMLKECCAVIGAREAMFVLTDITGESILIEAEYIPVVSVKTRTFSAAAEAV